MTTSIVLVYEIFFMPIVTIHLLEGRSEEQKEQAAGRIAEALAEIIDVDASKTQVIFIDVPASNWAHGNQLVSRRKTAEAHLHSSSG